MRKERNERRSLDPNSQVKITYRPISELKLDPKNPRAMSAALLKLGSGDIVS